MMARKTTRKRAGTKAKKPRKKKPKRRRKYIDVTFQQVADGWAIDGLKSGFVKVSPDYKPHFDRMSEDNSFWPWRLKCAGFVANFGWWAYRVTDTGEGKRVMGEKCEKTS